jgi:DNA-binding cell septation regulator SpoVG
MTKNDISGINMATGEWRKTRAFVTVKFANGLSVDGVKVIQGPKGLFVGMPSIQRKNKETQEMEWRNCCWLEDKEDQQAFQQAVLDVYNQKVNGDGGASTPSGKSDESSFF